MAGVFDSAIFDPDVFDTGLAGLIPRGATAALGVPGFPTASVAVPASSAVITVPARNRADVEA